MRDMDPNEYRPQVGAVYRNKRDGGFLSCGVSIDNDRLGINFYRVHGGLVTDFKILTNAEVHALIYGAPDNA